jgi:hypothetical protein
LGFVNVAPSFIEGELIESAGNKCRRYEIRTRIMDRNHEREVNQ